MSRLDVLQNLYRPESSSSSFGGGILLVHIGVVHIVLISDRVIAIWTNRYGGTMWNLIIIHSHYYPVYVSTAIDRLSHEHQLASGRFGLHCIHQHCCILISYVVILSVVVMKFSYELEYNAFGPWHDGYVNYKRLKKLIKEQRHDLEGTGITPTHVAWQVGSLQTCFLSSTDLGIQ